MKSFYALAVLFLAIAIADADLITCLPRICANPVAECPAVSEASCNGQSPCVRNDSDICGCCTGCLTELGIGDACAPFIRTSGVCAPGTTCSGGTCQLQADVDRRLIG